MVLVIILLFIILVLIKAYLIVESDKKERG